MAFASPGHKHSPGLWPSGKQNLTGGKAPPTATIAFIFLSNSWYFTREKPLWSSVKNTILPQSFFSPSCHAVSVIKANIVPPHILRIRASNCKYLPGNSCLLSVLLQLALGLTPRHQLAFCTYPFHNRCPEKHCFGTWGRMGEKKLNYLARCGSCNSHGKFVLFF